MGASAGFMVVAARGLPALGSGIAIGKPGAQRRSVVCRRPGSQSPVRTRGECGGLRGVLRALLRAAPGAAALRVGGARCGVGGLRRTLLAARLPGSALAA